jgi:hypothetical protein
MEACRLSWAAAHKFDSFLVFLLFRRWERQARRARRVIIHRRLDDKLGISGEMRRSMGRTVLSYVGKGGTCNNKLKERVSIFKRLVKMII